MGVDFNHFFCLIYSYLNLLMETSLVPAKFSHNYYRQIEIPNLSLPNSRLTNRD